MKSLIVVLASLTLLAAHAPATPHSAAAAPPIAASPEAIIVIGPFPLEVFGGADRVEPDDAVSGTTDGYLNLGFFEMNTVTGVAWPYGLGALLERAQLRAATPTPDAREG